MFVPTQGGWISIEETTLTQKTNEWHRWFLSSFAALPQWQWDTKSRQWQDCITDRDHCTSALLALPSWCNRVRSWWHQHCSKHCMDTARSRQVSNCEDVSHHVFRWAFATLHKRNDGDTQPIPLRGRRLASIRDSLFIQASSAFGLAIVSKAIVHLLIQASSTSAVLKDNRTVHPLIWASSASAI